MPCKQRKHKKMAAVKTKYYLLFQITWILRDSSSNFRHIGGKFQFLAPIGLQEHILLREVEVFPNET